MKLVELKVSEVNKILVNPAHVVSIGKLLNGKSRITLISDFTLDVDEDEANLLIKEFEVIRRPVETPRPIGKSKVVDMAKMKL